MYKRKRNKIEDTKTHQIIDIYEPSLFSVDGRVIPDEVIIYIFSFLSLHDLLNNISLTCKHWYHLSHSGMLSDRLGTNINHKNKKIIKKRRITKKNSKIKIGDNHQPSIILPNGNHIPNEIMVHIFSFLSRNEILKISIVCRHWYYLSFSKELWRMKGFQILPSNHRYGHLYGIKSFYGIRNIIKLIEPRSSCIQTLCIEPVPFAKNTLSIILKKCKELRLLQLIGPRIASNNKYMLKEDSKNNTLEQLEYGKNLVCLRIGYFMCSDNKINNIKYFSNLVHLDIVSGDYCLIKMIDSISTHCKNLMCLTLSTYERYSFFKMSPKKSNISASWEDLKKLEKCTNLKYISIKKFLLKIGSKDLVYLIKKLKDLITLRLSYLVYLCDDVYDESLFRTMCENGCKLYNLELKHDFISPCSIPYRIIERLSMDRNYNFLSHKMLRGKGNGAFYINKLFNCLIIGIPKILSRNYRKVDIIKNINGSLHTFIGSIFEAYYPVNRKRLKLFFEDRITESEYFCYYDNVMVWKIGLLALEILSYTKQCLDNGLILESKYGNFMDLLVNHLAKQMEESRIAMCGSFYVDFIGILLILRSHYKKMIDYVIHKV